MYMYIYIFHYIPRIPIPQFAAFESHNLVTGPRLAVYIRISNTSVYVNLAESSTYYPKPVYVLPIPYLTHDLPLTACRLFTQSVPMHT